MFLYYNENFSSHDSVELSNVLRYGSYRPHHSAGRLCKGKGWVFLIIMKFLVWLGTPLTALIAYSLVIKHVTTYYMLHGKAKGIRQVLLERRLIW
jgi:hypothetical protein